MATVKLIEYTGKGRKDEARHAANLLVFTKSTRLNMDAGLLARIQSMSDSEIRQELNYMANTIPSSWEFVDVTFLISGVSRATAQQITRSRNASFAMQSLRVVDASHIGVVNPFAYSDGDLEGAFEMFSDFARSAYREFINEGAAAQDARALLPLNTECSLVAKYNLRSFVDLIKARSSLRVQGEYSDIADQMKREVLTAWPWVEKFFESSSQKAIDILEGVAAQVGVETGKGPGWDIAKAIDLIRKG